MPNRSIYLDYNATTPCDPRVVEKMLPFFSEIYGNPANRLHQQGRVAAKAVDAAREKIALLIGASPNNIVFTGGATESNNLALFGLTKSQSIGRRKRIVTCAIEHKSVLYPCKKLAEAGFDVIILPVNTDGTVSIEAARKTITEDTLLVSIQLANNEIGTLQPINELSEITHAIGGIFHCDATQAVGKIPVNFEQIGVDIGSLSSHKIYGPKGVGALCLNYKNIPFSIEPIIYGGDQENRLRAGTTNVPAIVGFGEACSVASYELENESKRLTALRNLLEEDLLSRIPKLLINGNRIDRLPNTSSLTFPKIDADALILNTVSVMVGTGSACSSGAISPSHVLEAIGLSRDLAHSTIRISLGRYTNIAEITQAADDIADAYRKVSGIS